MSNEKLIYAEKLKLAIRDDPNIDGRNYAIMKRHIDAAEKVDAVEVVRCNQCFYWDKAKSNKKGFLICPASGMEIQADDFCSYGERKDNG